MDQTEDVRLVGAGEIHYDRRQSHRRTRLRMVGGGDLILPGQQLLDGVKGQEGQVGTASHVPVATERKT